MTSSSIIQPISTMDSYCTILLSPMIPNPIDKSNNNNNNNNSNLPITQDEILKGLENPKIDIKKKTLRSAITSLVNGETYPKLLMQIIRFCSTTTDHEFKKLLLIYWEIVPKYDNSNIKKLLPEMILVCNALLNDLNHPNEYIRGNMLRFLCKVKEKELIEPLKDAIKNNLSHRHSFVRRNAILTIYFIHKNFSYLDHPLIPDGPELIYNLIQTETDSGSRQNAFLMLCECSESHAIAYLHSVLNEIGKFGDGFSLLILELTRKICYKDSSQRSIFIPAIDTLLKNPSPAIAYEAAWTLITLTSAPTAIRAVGKTYCALLSSQSDNNIKLIILNKIKDLEKNHNKIVTELIYDILKNISHFNYILSTEIINITKNLVNSKNVDQVITIIKKEIIKSKINATNNTENNQNYKEYRNLLIEMVHYCGMRYPDTTNQIVPLLIEFLHSSVATTVNNDNNNTNKICVTSDSGLEVITFLKMMCEKYQFMRTDIIKKLLIIFNNITSTKIYRVALWILGEYSSDNLLLESFDAICSSLGDIPFVKDDTSELTKQRTNRSNTQTSVNNVNVVTKSIVLPDGTYATQAIYSDIVDPSDDNNENTTSKSSNLRKMILDGDFYLASIISSTIVKLFLRAKSSYPFIKTDNQTSNQEEDLYESITKHIIVDGLKYLCSFLIYGDNINNNKSILLKNSEFDTDSRQRICFNINILLNNEDTDKNDYTEATILEEYKNSYKSLLQEKELSILKKKLDVAPSSDAANARGIDDLIIFRQLREKNKALGSTDIDIDDTLNLSRATMGNDQAGPTTSSGVLHSEKSNLGGANNILSLTGFSDDIYCECYLTLRNSNDIRIDFLVINRTPNVCTNLTLELATTSSSSGASTASGSVNNLAPGNDSGRVGSHLKIIEKPLQNVNISPFDQACLHSIIKVSSTETGHIFGNISYTSSGSSHIINLNDIVIDINDFILPAVCTDREFRVMWAEFEWENKVAINTNINNIFFFVKYIVKSTNMHCLTKIPSNSNTGSNNIVDLCEENNPESEEEVNFLAVNLYAKSVFGEDALVNISIEKQIDNNHSNGRLSGYIRIRSKTQGIALSLGDRITSIQRGEINNNNKTNNN